MACSLEDGLDQYHYHDKGLKPLKRMLRERNAMIAELPFYATCRIKLDDIINDVRKIRYSANANSGFEFSKLWSEHSEFFE